MSYVEDGCYDTCLDVPHVHGGKLIAIPGGPGVAGPPGPAGPAGPEGPGSTVPGPEGPQGVEGPVGQPGVSLDIEGTVATYADLPASPVEGSAYVVAADGLLYFFDGTAFPASGAGVPFVGPQGQQGLQGVPGPAGPSAVSANPGNASVLGTDGLVFTPAGGGLVAAPSKAGFPVAGEAGRVYLAEDTGDTFRFDATAKGTDTYVRIAENTLSTAIEDSTVVGRAVLTAVDEAAARSAIGAEDAALKGQANGYAPLDASTKIDATYLPSYVDDVLEFATKAAFPATGSAGVIYVDLSNGNTWRWSGTTYVQISDKVTSTGITDSTPIGRSLVTAATTLAGRQAIAAAPVGGTVFVEDYRDGVRTDEQIIAAAFAALKGGGELRFGNGVTYTFTTPGGFIDVFFNSTRHNITINGQGATLDGAAAKAYALLRIQGGRDSGTTSLTAAIPKRINTITVASTAGFKAGDIISIDSSGEPFNLDGGSPDPINFKQEMARVKSVTNTTTIVLEQRTWNTYSTTGYTVTVRRFDPMKNFVIRDLNFVGVRTLNSADVTTQQYGLWVRYFDGVTVENVKVNGTTESGITGQNGMNFTVSKCRVENVLKVSGGVSIYAIDCHEFKVVDCLVRGGKHAVDIDRARDVLYMGNTVEGTGAGALSTHGNCDVAKIVDNTVRECGGGIIVRGKNTLVKGNQILGSKLPAEQSPAMSYMHGITIGHGAPAWYGEGNGGIDLVIDGNFIDISGPDWASEPTRVVNGIHSSAGLVNSRIVNNTIRGFSWHGIFAFGDYSRNAEISGNFIDCSAQVEPSGCGIRVDSTHTTAGCVQTNLSVERNVITKTIMGSGVYVSGGPSASDRSDHVRVHDNVIGPCGSAPINMSDGFYGDDISVVRNQAEDVKAVLFTVANWLTAPYVGDHGYGRAPRPLGVGQELGARMRNSYRYGPTCSPSPAATALNRLTAVPLFIPRRVTLDRIGVNVTTAAAAGAQALLGIYADLPDGAGGYPGALVAGSTGTVATDAVAYVEATISVTVNPGLYWLAFVPQTAAPSVSVITGSTQSVGSAAFGLANRTGFMVDGVTGALPAKFTSTEVTQGSMPYVQVRVATTPVTLEGLIDGGDSDYGITEFVDADLSWTPGEDETPAE